MLSLRTIIASLTALSVAVVAALTLSLTLTSSLAALRDIGVAHASVLLDGAVLKTGGLFDTPLMMTEALQNTTAKYAWPWPSDDPTTFDRLRWVHETLYFSSKMTASALMTYYADNSRHFFGPFIPNPELYVMQNHIASSITAAGWDFDAQTIVNDVAFWRVSNHSLAPPDDWAWTVPLALSKVRQTTLWDGVLVMATGRGQQTVIAPIALVNFAGINNLYVPVVAPLYRNGDAKTVANLYGVVIVGMYIDEISNFLHDIAGTPGTVGFATEQSGHLVASSMVKEYPYQVASIVKRGTPVQAGCASTEGTDGISTSADVNMVCRLHASAYPSRPLQAMAAMTTDDGEPWLTYDGSAVKHVAVDDANYYVATSHLPLRAAGMSVQLLLSMPEADIIGDVFKARDVAIGVTCAVVVVVALLMFALITWLLQPLSRISENMERAAAFEEAPPEAISRMNEVAGLQLAFQAMSAELARVRSFVPQSVLLAPRGGQVEEEEIETESEPEQRVDSRNVYMPESTPSVRSVRSSASSNHHRPVASRQSGERAAADGPSAALVLHAQNATVLACNLTSFHQVTSAMTTDVTAQHIAEIVELVQREVRANLGVGGLFNGDSFVASFNAVKPCPSHARRASISALTLASKALETGFRLPMRCGVSSGRVIVGNAGSSEIKSFNIIGAAYTQAVLLQRLAKLYGPECSVLATDRTITDVATHVRFKYLDWVRLPGRKSPALIGSLLGTTTLGKMLLSTGDQFQANEWMYVVENAAAADPNFTHNETFSHLVHGEWELALHAKETARAAPASVESAANETHIPSGLLDSLEQKLQWATQAQAAAVSGASAKSSSSLLPPTDLGPFYNIAVAPRW
jgi:class 3 adenylate cyclase